MSSLVNRTQYDKGALLIIPNQHLSTILDVSAELIGAIYTEARLLSKVLVEHLGATGLNIFQNNVLDANQHVPHFHTHVVPRYPGSDPTKIYNQFDFEPITLEQQEQLAKEIRHGLAVA